MLGRLVQDLLGTRIAPDASNEDGIRCWQAGDLVSAERAFRTALSARPDYAAACSNLGMVLVEQRRFDEGLTALNRAIAIDPDHVGARVNLANVLHIDGKLELALAHYNEALRIDPQCSEARVNMLKPLMDVCEWEAVRSRMDELLARYRADAGGDWMDQITPFEAQLLPFPPGFHKALAAHHGGKLTAAYTASRAAIATERPTSDAASGKRIRIGYASGELKNHAVGHLTAGLFALHDRSRFEVIAYSWGADDGSDYRRRIVAGCDRFCDVAAESFEQTARRIARDGIDVLVNMNGYSGGARNEIFALRPAPVQIQWLGYPGTMGADFIDYLIADEVVLPRESEGDFTEAIARLPDCYQVNDNAQAIAVDTPSRADCGLPERSVVFCCFNQTYKIEPVRFATWMRVLAQVPGSVLWLLGPNRLVEQNLRREAAQLGIDPARLVFAPSLPKAGHLARHRQVDLFLDTRAINAGTTASDALWAGVPVLTCPGEILGARVAASMLRALGMPEMIAVDEQDYEAKAIALGRDPAALAALKAKVAVQRACAPLFDTALFVRRIEAALEIMVQRARSGAPPRSFSAPG
ncbi:MAG: tetratricopeptide repeat protein [Betaproteobacteria bacterium]|nr:tetratricopeptide repeat protein [Betaproteobacteria bacterium]